METTFKKGDTAYFFDWRDKYGCVNIKKVPVLIQKVNRKTCDVSALDTSKNFINVWQDLNVPIDYLKATKDFTVEGTGCSLLGQFIIWKNKKGGVSK